MNDERCHVSLEEDAAGGVVLVVSRAGVGRVEVPLAPQDAARLGIALCAAHPEPVSAAAALLPTEVCALLATTFVRPLRARTRPEAPIPEAN